MTVFLLILKIIGIILLVLLGIILYFIFSPITYSVKAELYDKKVIRVRLGDVLRLFSLKFVREDKNELTIELLFGLIKIHPSKKKKKKEEPEKEEEEEKEEESREEKKKKKADNKAALKKVLENKEGLKVVLSKVMKLLKKIFPHIKHADLDFALASPETTGKVVGAMSLVPLVYGRNISIRPDFYAEKAYARGNIEIAGKIFLFYVIYIIISMFADKRSRSFLKALIAFAKRSKKK